MNRILFLLITAFSLLAFSCSKMPNMSKIPGLSRFYPPEETAEDKANALYTEFTQKEGYPKFSESFKNEELLALATNVNTSVTIDLSDQRAMLLVDESVALDIPCCTGRSGKRTPTGTFPIMEKIVQKRSNIYGKLYNGSRVVYGGDRRKYTGSSTKFVGTSLPYWMRLTGDGIGLHYSKSVKRYPASGGCIRMPMEGIKTIFSKVKRGTTVTVQP